MLKRENELRLSEDTQRRFAEAERSGSKDWIDVAREIQKGILIEFNIEPTERALLAYRCAANKHGISLYVIYNRAREGELKVGSDAVDVSLVTVDDKFTRTSLLAHQKLDRPLIVVAGSFS